ASPSPEISYQRLTPLTCAMPSMRPASSRRTSITPCRRGSAAPRDGPRPAARPTESGRSSRSRGPARRDQRRRLRGAPDQERVELALHEERRQAQGRQAVDERPALEGEPDRRVRLDRALDANARG